jgi:Diacylglycerol kinase catalytic domain
MKRTLLVTNANSGSAGAVNEEALQAAFHAAGFEIIRRITLPDDELCGRTAVETDNADIVAIVSGDGTISSLCANLAGWGGGILVLPGGTMNLLSRRLHGEFTLTEIFERLPQISPESAPVSIVRLGGREILTGLTVGPSTRWGEVREGIRHGDVSALTEIVPAAWSETLSDEGVWVEGREKQAYAGVFVEPVNADTLSVIAFRANTIGDMVGHGLAWLRRDFREGPRDELGLVPEVTILGDKDTAGILVDGEQDECSLPLTCAAGVSSVRFLRISP